MRYDWRTYTKVNFCTRFQRSNPDWGRMWGRASLWYSFLLCFRLLNPRVVLAFLLNQIPSSTCQFNFQFHRQLITCVVPNIDCVQSMVLCFLTPVNRFITPRTAVREGRRELNQLLLGLAHMRFDRWYLDGTDLFWLSSCWLSFSWQNAAADYERLVAVDLRSSRGQVVWIWRLHTSELRR